MKKWLGSAIALLVVVTSCGGLFVGIAYADSSSSAHYTFINSDLGGGGLVQAHSTNYKSVESTGDNAVGNSSSANYTAAAGSVNPKDPTLSIGLINGNATFNQAFSPTATATATAQFSVVDYTSYGYVVQIVGNAPTNGAHSIAPMSNGSGGPTTSSTGTEQFGINLTQNSSPSVGALPNYGQFGAVSAGPEPHYNTANNFMYSNGDTVAYSPKSSGQVTYTVSYMVNVGDLTPGGQYTSNQSIICTGTY